MVPFRLHYVDVVPFNPSVGRFFMWCSSRASSIIVAISFVQRYRFPPLTASRTLLSLSDVTVGFRDHRATTYRRRLVPWHIYWSTLLDVQLLRLDLRFVSAGRFFPSIEISPQHQSAMETPCPYSPETAAFVTSSLEAWNRFLADGDSQSDVDSAQEIPEDSDSSTEESVDELLLSVLPTPSMPPKSDQIYEQLASVMGASYLDLAELDVLRLEAIVEEVYNLLRDTILTGYCRRWADFDRWLDFGHKLSKVLVAKRASAMPEEEDYDGDVDSEQLPDWEEDPRYALVEMEEDPADEDFIRELYSRDIKELLDWDDVAF